MVAKLSWGWVCILLLHVNVGGDRLVVLVLLQDSIEDRDHFRLVIISVCLWVLFECLFGVCLWNVGEGEERFGFITFPIPRRYTFFLTSGVGKVMNPGRYSLFLGVGVGVCLQAIILSIIMACNRQKSDWIEILGGLLVVW